MSASGGTDGLAPRPLPSRQRVLLRGRVFNLGGKGEATRLHRLARCSDVGGQCAGPDGQDFACWIPGRSSPSQEAHVVDAFRKKLRELGHVEGDSFVIEFRWAEGRHSRLPALAAEVVRLKPDVIVTTGTPGSLTTKRATSNIPIVFASSGNPVAAGLVSSFSLPSGNITGFTVSGPELEGKRVQLLKEVVSLLSRVAVVWNSANPAILDFYQQTRAAGAALGFALNLISSWATPMISRRLSQQSPKPKLMP
jgi:ABC-type uncharacterized transport system substrate-binding protein